jgi:hypothetical protein
MINLLDAMRHLNLSGHFVVAALKKSQHFNCAEGGENQGS